MHRFGEEVLGKGIVYSKDTPNFVANRIGVFAMMSVLHRMSEDPGYSPEEIDAIFGQASGRPKSAVFRTADIVGLDSLVLVADHCHELLVADEQRETFALPSWVRELVKRGNLGDKSGKGFYYKPKDSPKSSKSLMTFDPKTLDYRPQEKPDLDSVREAKGEEDVRVRVKKLVAATDKAGAIAWKVTRDTLIYAANRVGEICDDIVQIDRAMRWGFNWELGPFEGWDALGVQETAARIEKDGLQVPALVKSLLASGRTSFYEDDGHRHYDASKKSAVTVPQNPRALAIGSLAKGNELARNESASLRDMGDGCLLLDFHAKMNAIDADIVTMMNQAVDLAEEKFEALVVGNEAADAFSAGANLFLVLMAAQGGEFAQLETMVHEFQQANRRLRESHIPTVSAPFGLTLGGGAEVTLATDAAQAHAELYMGLVEVGVGLVPGGGGVKEMALRHTAGLPDEADLTPHLRRAFEQVAMAKICTSAAEAREARFLDPRDGITFNREFLLHSAKSRALGMARAGYTKPRPRLVRVAGRAGFASLSAALWAMEQQHQISEHDAKIAGKVARILTGGDVPANARVTEQHLLDLEREAFLSLCGEPKTHERISFMLMNNKPLRN